LLIRNVAYNLDFSLKCDESRDRIVNRPRLPRTSEFGTPDYNQKVISRRNKRVDFGSEAQAQYYSDWSYMAVWLASSIESLPSNEAIGHKLGINRTNTTRIVDFLLSAGLCVETENGLRPSVTNTHLSNSSPLVNRHHVNWRLKAIERLPGLTDDELSFTAPVSLSAEDFKKIKMIILNAIEDISTKVEASDPQVIAYPNIDWHEVKP
jgi:hypothetical protein